MSTRVFNTGAAARDADPAPTLFYDDGTPAASPATPVWSVEQAVGLLRRAVTPVLDGHWIAGEVSNLARPASGHTYFTLKDGTAQIRCVFFAMSARRHPVSFKVGDKIEVFGSADVYVRGGELQIRLADWRPAGAGALYEAYLRLKEKLRREGLFDANRKKRLPAFVRRVIIVTSPQAAALHDAVRTLRRRTPWIDAKLAKAPVQGKDAPAGLIAALKKADQYGVDAILLIRGGGSFEDLFCFNDEALVRTIAAMKTPVIAGIGHESDETLATLAADVGASTPTAAAEQLGPDARYWLDRLATIERRLTQSVNRRLEDAALGTDAAAERLEAMPDKLFEHHTVLLRRRRLLEQLTDGYFSRVKASLTRGERLLQRPDTVLAAKTARRDAALARFRAQATVPLRDKAAQTERLGERLSLAAGMPLERADARLAGARRHFPDPEQWLNRAAGTLDAARRTLAALDPKRPLRDGYVLIENAEGPVEARAEVRTGDTVRLCWADGTATAVIEAIN